MARIRTAAATNTISASDFESAWLSLIDQGILAQMDDGVAAITNTGARRLRDRWLMSAISVLLILWVMWKVPDFAGEDKDGDKPSLLSVFTMPGVRPSLFVTLALVLAHNILYTYITPLLQFVGTVGQTDRVLLVFGLVALASIFITGALIDRFLRPLIVVGLGLFMAASVMLAFASGSTLVVYAAAAIWGLAFGGFGPLIQTATLRAAGSAADVATSMIVTLWNVGIASLPWSLLILLIPALAVVALIRTFGAHGAGFDPTKPVAAH